jgi:lysozyme family protein
VKLEPQDARVLAAEEAEKNVNSLRSKPWYKSKTVWFNILSIGGAILGGLLGVMPTVQPFLTPMSYAIAMAVIGAGNIVLRAITTGPRDWREDVQSD